jgi:electron transfer flavoprotein alpha/beta subunit
MKDSKFTNSHSARTGSPLHPSFLKAAKKTSKAAKKTSKKKTKPKFVESELKVKASKELEEEIRAELEEDKEEKSIANLIQESGVCPEENNEA